MAVAGYLPSNRNNCAIGQLDVFVIGRKEIFYLTMHPTHFIYSYMASDIRLKTIQRPKEEIRYRHYMGYPCR